MDEEVEGDSACFMALCMEMMHGRPSRHVHSSALLNVLHMALICRVPCWNVLQNWVKETNNIKNPLNYVVDCHPHAKKKRVCVCARYVSLSEQFVCV